VLHLPLMGHARIAPIHKVRCEERCAADRASQSEPVVREPQPRHRLAFLFSRFPTARNGYIRGVVGFVIFLLVWGLLVGALARLAVPGPDPMPIWATIALGLGGSIVGGFVLRALGGTGPGLIGAVIFAMLLLVGYRRFVQKRPLWGPGARLPPPRP
jgi:uncharacterized membrane protein YeaQ/YmgE (transglycosylase-associated protein family)